MLFFWGELSFMAQLYFLCTGFQSAVKLKILRISFSEIFRRS